VAIRLTPIGRHRSDDACYIDKVRSDLKEVIVMADGITCKLVNMSNQTIQIGVGGTTWKAGSVPTPGVEISSGAEPLVVGEQEPKHKENWGWVYFRVKGTNVPLQLFLNMSKESSLLNKCLGYHDNSHNRNKPCDNGTIGPPPYYDEGAKCVFYFVGEFESGGSAFSLRAAADEVEEKG
jgi:hypothetical protein